MDYLKKYDIFGWQCPLHNGQSVLLGEKYTEHSRSQPEHWLMEAWDRYSKNLSGSLKKMERKWGISIPSEIFILIDAEYLDYVFQDNKFRQSSKSMMKKGQKGKVICIKSTDIPIQKPIPPNSKPYNCSCLPAYFIEIRRELCTVSRCALPSAGLNKWYQFFCSTPGDISRPPEWIYKFMLARKKSIGLFGVVLGPLGLIFCM